MSNPDSAMNLKFSKKEKIALIGLSALLIGYGIYQTAYGTGQGKDEFVNCQDFDADCNSALMIVKHQ
jgi:hypothetical protein